MKLSLSTSEFLDLWRLHAEFQPPVADSGFNCAYAVDTGAILTSRMELWYRNLLHSGPEHLLAPADIASDVVFEADGNGSGSVFLPDNVVRILEIRLSGWTDSARIVTDPADPLALMQRRPVTRATREAPVAVVGRNRVDLFPADSSDTLMTLRCVVYREGIFEFDSAALATLNV